VIEEKEAFKAGLIIAAVMLASGFSMLFVPNYTGSGAVVLSLGVMTMVLVLMTRILISEIRRWMDYSARVEETISELLTFRDTLVPEQVLKNEQNDHKKKLPNVCKQE
jgi:hypothetical protein